MGIESVVAAILRLPSGRSCTWSKPALHMARLVVEAGDGDHLEIGVLHGATLIMAALLKEEYKLSGTVYGIDPMAGFYPAGPMNPDGVLNDYGTELITKPDDNGVPVTMENLTKNIDHFHIGHRIKVVQAFSHPWPEELAAHRFVSAYIDGDHYREGPTNDWKNVHPRTDKLVWFDDCNHHCPAVQRARLVAAATPGWRERELYANHILVMERTWNK